MGSRRPVVSLVVGIWGIWLLVAAGPVPAVLAGQVAATLRGQVVDPSGAAIPDALVTVQAEGTPMAAALARTDREGRFTVAVPGAGVGVRWHIAVAATGFAALDRAVGASALEETGLQLVVQPAPLFESVSVTSSRGDLPRVDPTVTISVLTAADLDARAAVTLDDALKLVPGFTLFRRSSSRVSNPTAQGITLRGLGGTGSSRSLVLADGLPLNDAFGGWVYWDKLPQAAIDRVEVLRGSGSDLYGADAVGGVVQILTRRPARRSLHALGDGGSLGTGRASVFAGGRSGGWTYTGSGQWFTTDGYVLIPPDQRGPVDTPAGSGHRSLLATLGYQGARGWRIEAGANVFTEDRRNGTRAVYNATASRRAWLSTAGGLAGGWLSAQVYGGTQGYDQAFSAVTLDRTSEDLNRLQRIPTEAIGAGAQWVRPFGGHALLVGAERRFIEGRTQETRLTQGRVLGLTDDGGRQRIGSVFVQDTWTAHARLTVVAGLHADGWRTRANNTGYDRTLGAFNPRVSAAWALSPILSMRGSAYGGFRAPTLNELYRGFRTGNTQVNPNESLAPERLRGADWGLVAAGGPVSARATVFWNELRDVVTNVTQSRTPTLITQQRQNADRLRSAGAELEAAWQTGPWAATLSAAWVHATFAGATAVRGNRVPQVPRAQAGLDVRYARAGWTASAQVRVTGTQFEDDLNLLRLRRATVVDATAARALGTRVQVFGGVENLLDEQYDVGRTPLLTIGLPRALRTGVRLTF